VTAGGVACGLLGAVVLSGCGGQSEKVDEGVVAVSEPTAKASSANPSPTPTPAAPSGTAPAAPAEEADAAKSETAPAAVAEGWGTLKGRVVFGGDAPTPKTLVEVGKAVKDPEVCGAKEAIPSERLVVNKDSKGVRYAVVFIPRPTRVNPDAEKSVAETKVVFDQKNCVFVPHVIGVYKGATVEVLNSDPVGHNVNSRLRFNTFNFAVQPNAKVDQPTKTAESRPGEVVCDIHPWMKSWWLVSPSPYFAITDENGNFEIKNVPAGEQKVIVWAEALHPGFLTAGQGDAVNVPADGEAVKEFTIDPAKVKPE
jgi:plastocyanin